MTAKRVGDAWEYWYAGKDTDYERVGRGSCVETKRTLVEGVLGQEGGFSPRRTLDGSSRGQGRSRLTM